MKRNFIDQLIELQNEAKGFITEEIKKKGGKIILSTQDEDGEWDQDIFELPDFGNYNKHGFEDFANIFELEAKEDGLIEVHAITKGYGVDITADLNQLSSEELIHLAAWIEEPGSPTSPEEAQPITVSSTPLLPPYKESQLFDPSTL